MRLLLDTHALLWWHAGDPRLGKSTAAAIGHADNEIRFSIASLWEIVIKSRIGKLDADVREIVDASEADGFRRTDIALAHLEQLAQLPSHHRDPFDHLLIAQAISDGLTFVTSDPRAGLYPVELMRCADAR